MPTATRLSAKRQRRSFIIGVKLTFWILRFKVQNIISLAGVVVMKLHKHKSMDSVLRNILPSGEYLQEKYYVSAHAFHDLIS